MSMYVDSNNKLHHLFDQHFALNCPHCEVLSHVTAVSIPQYNLLVRFKPKQVGIVYRCDSCNSPLFLRFSVKAYGTSRVEFSTCEGRNDHIGLVLVDRLGEIDIFVIFAFSATNYFDLAISFQRVPDDLPQQRGQFDN